MNNAFWDSRYAEGLAYGEEPNAYLAQSVQKYLGEQRTRPLSILCLAEGQGRNALFLAKAFPAAQVVAVDYSEVGVQCTLSLAKRDGLADRVHAYVADLATYDLLQHCESENKKYDLIISIFAHTPSPIRKRVHGLLRDTLTQDGLFVLQAYTPSNIGRGTGGPQAEDFCMTRAALLEEIQGLEVSECEEREAEINEGQCHQGVAAVVQGVWQKL